MGFSKKCLFWDPVFWPLTSNKCMGLQKVANWLQFYRRSFDEDSKSVNFFFWIWNTRDRGMSILRILTFLDLESIFARWLKYLQNSLKKDVFCSEFFTECFSKVDSVPSGTTYVKKLRPGHGIDHGRGHGHRCGETADSLIRRTRDYIRCLSVVWIFQKNLTGVCPMSGFCPKFLKKALFVVCLSGLTRKRQRCPDFRCPWLPTSDAIHNLLTINHY